MALREKVLIKKAEKFELKELQKIIANREQLLKLDRLLDESYLIRRPKPVEYEQRQQLIRVINDIAKDIYGNSASCPVVEEFGSFSMDLFTTESDLDLSINFRNRSLTFPRDQKIKTLRRFARKFYSLQNGGHVKGVQPIMSAKVPIVKVVDTGTGIECDLSVENRDGISKSLIIRSITSIDQRFQKLSFLMKAWAKAHDINSSKDRTLNSLSIILLVAFHLQTRDPPILPPFSAILKDGVDLASVEKSVKSFQNYGIRNRETLGELFMSFLMKLASVEKLWPKGLCASTYLGHWTSKTWDTNKKTSTNKIASMSVEDFTDRTQNVARAVGKSEIEEIYRCIHLANRSLGLFMSNDKIEERALKESLFDIDKTLPPHVDPTGWSRRQPPMVPSGVPLPPYPEFNILQNVYRHLVAATNPPMLTGVMDSRAAPGWSTRQPPMGGHSEPPHRAVTAGPYHQPTKRMRVEEVAMSSRGPAWEGPGGAFNGGWGGSYVAADHHQRRQEIKPPLLQQTRYGSSYGPPFV